MTALSLYTARKRRRSSYSTADLIAALNGARRKRRKKGHADGARKRRSKHSADSLFTALYGTRRRRRRSKKAASPVRRRRRRTSHSASSLDMLLFGARRRRRHSADGAKRRKKRKTGEGSAAYKKCMNAMAALCRGDARTRAEQTARAREAASAAYLEEIMRGFQSRIIRP